LGDDAQPNPRTHYGVYKQANEGTARVYWLDNGISSIGLRPYTIYGPGRDQGLTSGPSKAMAAAAFGRPYYIPFSGRQGLQLADDAAKLFIQAARTSFNGAGVFNLRGSVVAMEEIIAAIEAAEPSAAGRITFAGPPLPFPEELDDAGLRAALGSPPHTPLATGVAQTISIFKAALAAGRIDAERALGT
jgi:nucleoside-diphosphate-sugar epimerase